VVVLVVCVVWCGVAPLQTERMVGTEENGAARSVEGGSRWGLAVGVREGEENIHHHRCLLAQTNLGMLSHRYRFGTPKGGGGEGTELDSAHTAYSKRSHTSSDESTQEL
jgi:hypothetical protein